MVSFREDTTSHGVQVVFTSMSHLQTVHISILYEKSLQWWFHCRWLQTCVGPVCVRGTELMCHGRECTRLGSHLDTSPSTCRWTVEVYVPPDPHQGASVVFGS